jgi:hypothetical protein
MVRTAKASPHTTEEDDQELSLGKFISNARGLMRRISWLSPPASLDKANSSEFGRNIERSLNDLPRHNGVINLVLRKHTKAVVMSIQHYEQLLEMKESYSKLLEIESERTVSNALEDFNNLYSRITSPASASAADSLFSASAEDLKKSFRPGETESTL